MNSTSELMKILDKNLDWHKSRLNCFAKMLLALIVVRTVNLRELAVAFDSNAQVDSRYKRIKRFLAKFKIKQEVLAKLVFKLFFAKSEKIYLTIDRTNWFWGKAKINILTVGVAHEGSAIPLFWFFLDNAGNATGKEHSMAIRKFVSVFGKDCIAGVLADREFANQYFFKYLNEAEIPFYIRVKEGSMVRIFLERTFKVGKLFNKLNPKEQMPYIQPVTIHGQKLFVAAGRSDSGELLVVATNQFKAKNAVSIYLRRWEIEVLFQNLKNRGFNFEDTHVTKHDRINNVMSLLVVGFCWAHKVGEWRDAKKSIVFNKYRNGRRPQYSFFRYGLDFIRDVLLHISRLKRQFRQCLKMLFPPPEPLIMLKMGAEL